MPRVGQRRKKKHTHKVEEEGEHVQKHTPRSFVVKKGHTSNDTKDLIKDFRDVMSPHSAKSLHESKHTRIRDYVIAAGRLNVSHLMMFTNTDLSTIMRIARLPQGPTLTFRVAKYSLSRDIQAAQKRPHKTRLAFLDAPLLVMNGMNGQNADTKLIAQLIRNMFPPIDVETFSTSSCRRVVLFHMEKNNTIQFRHFAITTKMHGVSRSVQKLMDGKVNVDAERDIADYILKGGYASDSEVEDLMPAEIRRKKAKKLENVGVHLVEIGPRMELVPVKAQEGLMDGAVLFHNFVKKSPEEKIVADKKAKERMAQREKNDKLAVKKASKKAELRRVRKEKERKKQDKLASMFSDDEKSDNERPAKRQKFNPLFKKKSTPLVGDGQAEKTVDFDTGPRTGATKVVQKTHGKKKRKDTSKGTKKRKEPET